MSRRGPQRRDDSRYGMISIRVSEQEEAEIKEALDPTGRREALVEAARRKKLKGSKKR